MVGEPPGDICSAHPCLTHPVQQKLSKSDSKGLWKLLNCPRVRNKKCKRAWCLWNNLTYSLEQIISRSPNPCVTKCFSRCSPVRGTVNAYALAWQKWLRQITVEWILPAVSSDNTAEAVQNTCWTKKDIAYKGALVEIQDMWVNKVISE